MLRWCVLGISAAVALTGCASLDAGTGAGGTQGIQSRRLDRAIGR